MKLSVIIPIYNSKEYLMRTMDNIKKQTLSSTIYEVIFVDDYSTDGTYQMLSDYSKEQNNIQVKRPSTKGGAGGARNFGLHQARGEYIIFMDADDTIENHFFETMLFEIETTKADISICNFYINGTPESLEYYEKNTRNKMLQPLVPWNKIFRKSFLLNTKIVFQEKLRHQDLGTISKWMYLAKKITYCKSYLYNYHQLNSGSISARTVQNFNMDIYHILDDLYDFFKDKDIVQFEKIMNLHLVGRYEIYSKHNYNEALKYTRFLNNYIVEKTKESKTFSFKNTNNIKHEIMHKMSRYTNGIFPVLVFKTIKWVKR